MFQMGKVYLLRSPDWGAALPLSLTDVFLGSKQMPTLFERQAKASEKGAGWVLA